MCPRPSLRPDKPAPRRGADGRSIILRLQWWQPLAATRPLSRPTPLKPERFSTARSSISSNTMPMSCRWSAAGCRPRISHSAIVGRADGREPGRRSLPHWRPGRSRSDCSAVAMPSTTSSCNCRSPALRGQYDDRSRGSPPGATPRRAGSPEKRVVAGQTPNVKRLPVFQSTSCPGISSRILAMKARPVQCIGITTSGLIAFNSAIVCST